MLLNITEIFMKNLSIPVDILLGPLLKQIRVSEGISFSFKLFDFHFLSRISRHPKLSLKTAISAIDILAKVYLEDVRFSLPALVPMVLLIERFRNVESLREYLREMVKLFITRLAQLENK